MPATVARALAHAVREALANVASHAGTGEAWVEVSLADGEMLVTVRDAGAGFDPGQVAPGRLGVRRSIIERVAEHGGQVAIRSAPAGEPWSACGGRPSPGGAAAGRRCDGALGGASW